MAKTGHLHIHIEYLLVDSGNMTHATVVVPVGLPLSSSFYSLRVQLIRVQRQHRRKEGGEKTKTILSSSCIVSFILHHHHRLLGTYHLAFASSVSNLLVFFPASSFFEDDDEEAERLLLLLNVNEKYTVAAKNARTTAFPSIAPGGFRKLIASRPSLKAILDLHVSVKSVTHQIQKDIKMSSSCASFSSFSFSSPSKKKQESAASRSSSYLSSSSRGCLRVRSLDPSPSVISPESSPTSLKMMKEEEDKEEEDKVVVVVFTNFSTKSHLKYPRSLPEYSEDKKPSGEVSWKEVWEHMRLRLKWSNDMFETILVDCADTETLSKAKEACSKATAFIACEVGESEIIAEKIRELTVTVPTGVVCGKSSATLRDLQKLQFMPMHDAGHNDFFEMPFETRREKDKKKFLQMKTLFDRKNHLDLLFMSLVLIDACEVPGIVVPEVAINQEINIGNVWCIASNCGSKLLDCYKNPQCRKSLDCVDACGMNDQVCTYTCIRSYQNREFEYLARCMLHSHNCLGNDAKRPEFPIVKPMKTFRGEALTHEVAEQIMQGHLGTERDGKKIDYSWLAVAGQNPAYDHFPAQYQIWYAGKARNSFWYNPVFKVNTLDGRSVWRRSDYRCKREDTPGTFMFTFMDNGVTSKEYWRIVDAADDLSWALYYYAGAAKSAGQMYVGAVLATPDGLWPPTREMERVERALWEGCGCKMWEMMEVDNRPDVIANAPLQPLHDVVLKPSLILPP